MKGSIEKRGENSWRLRVDLGYNPDGTRNRPSKTITVDDPALLRTTKKLRDYLEDQLAEFKRQVLSGEYIAPARLTFGDFYEKEWKPKYAEPNLKRTTYLSHCSKIDHHVLPYIGHLRMDEITTMRLVDLFAQLRKPGNRADGKSDQRLKSRTIQYIYDVTNSIFKCAVGWRVIQKNPLEGVKRPQISKEDLKARKDRHNYFEEDEAEQVINALLDTNDNWRLYFLGAILGGFRRGELIALQEDDCDLVNNRIRIDENISHTENGEALVTDPKNRASEDWVDMPEWYMRELKELIKQNHKIRMKALNKWQGGNRRYVFHSGFGKPYYHTVPTQAWTRWCKRNGFRNVTLHGLRHTNATYLLSSGATIKEIQHRLRHSNSQVTNDYYAHVTKKLSKQTVAHLEKFAPKSRPQSVPNIKNDGISS